MKLKREAHGLYLKVGTQPYFLIGSGIDDMSVEMNGSFENKKDVTGATSVEDNGYTPQISVEPYYANPDDAIYPFLKDLALNRKSGEDAKAKYLEVIVEDTTAASHDAWEEDCRIEIASYGGDTSGLQIAYNIYPDGNREQGTATFTNKVPTFSAASQSQLGGE